MDRDCYTSFKVLQKNRGVKVIIDTNNHVLTYRKGNYEIKFNRDDIFRCEIRKPTRTRYSTDHNYSLVWFILNDRTYVVITCFVGNPFQIVELLNCKSETKATASIPVF